MNYLQYDFKKKFRTWKTASFIFCYVDFLIHLFGENVLKNISGNIFHQ